MSESQDPKSKLTVDLTHTTRRELMRIAEGWGCITTSGGPMQGQPSLTQLLELIAAGEVVLRPRQEVLPGVIEFPRIPDDA